MQNKIRKLKDHVREYGLQSTATAAADRILRRQVREVPYERWLERGRLSSLDYARMSRKKLAYAPVFAVRSYAKGEDRTVFLQSLETQVYRNYSPLKDHTDPEYILLCRSGCMLSPAILWQCADYLSRSEGEIDLIYFDSDRIGRDGKKREPAFRPAYDPDLLEQVNYIGDIVLVRTAAARQAGFPERDPRSFHDFLKRVCFRHTVEAGQESVCAIRHIPMVLYHEFEQQPLPEQEPVSGQESGSEPENGNVPDTKEAEDQGEMNTAPLISVLIPNRDHADDLARCIRSLQEVNTWENLEILILENNSARKETFDLYDELQKSDPRIRVLTYDRPFNYSAINNFGAENASGSLLLFLNNDTRILESESLTHMARLALREDVGAVGALLLYPDQTIQHGGIILGYGGIAGHAFAGEASGSSYGVFPNLVLHHTHNVCAVTGACLMLRSDVFQQAGGFDEDLEVTFNDVDLCLRLRAGGARVLMCPQARLIHYESASRGSEDSPEKVARFHSEIRTFISKWENELEKGDPFYNPNLTLTLRSWTCRDVLREPAKPYLKYLNL